MSPVKKLSYSFWGVLICTLIILAIGQTAFPALGDEDLFNDLTATPSSAVSHDATPSSAAFRDATPSNSEDPVEITRIFVSDAETGNICLLERGTSSSSLSFHLDCNSVGFYRENKRFPERNVQFSVVYHTDEFDAAYRDHTGLVFLNASIILEDERYELSPEVETTVSLPVFLYDPNRPAALPELPPQTAQMSRITILAPVHSDLGPVKDELYWLRPEFYLEFADGVHSLVVPSLWDLSSVDMNTPGIYTAYHTPALPQGVLLDDMPREAVPINIQDPEAFALSAPTERHSKLMIRWLYPTPDQSLFRRWYRMDSGEWMEDTSDTLMTLSVYDGASCLLINPYELDPNSIYQFQLEYDGAYSDVLEIRLQDSGFSYSKHEGDRDGGDRNDQTPPDVNQTPPETPQPLPEENQTPSGESQPPAGDNQTPSGESQPPAGDSQTPSGESQPSAGDSQTPSGESQPPAGNTQTPPGSGGKPSPVITVPGQTTAGGPGFPAQTTDISGSPSPTPAREQTGATSESPEAARAGFSYIPVPSDKEAPEEDAPAVTSGMEADTAHMTVWSGTRILKYLETSPRLPLVFEKHRIRLEIPADAAFLSKVAADDFLRVEIEALSDDTVSLELALNEVPLTDLPLTVTMPWTGNTGAAAFQVKDETGALLEDADCSRTDGLLTFHVRRAGTYTVVEVDNSEAASVNATGNAQPDPQANIPADAQPDSQTDVPADSLADARTIPPAMAVALAVVLAAALTGGVIMAGFRKYRKGGRRH